MTGRLAADPLAYGAASRVERRIALGVSLVLAAFAGVAVRYGARGLGENDAVLPASVAASLVTLFVSAALLGNQYRLTRFAPFAFLGTAYGCSALLLLPYMLTYPRVSGAWCWIAWHAAFVILCGVYVWSEIFMKRDAPREDREGRIVRTYVRLTAVLALAAVAFLLGSRERLPLIIAHGTYTPEFRLVAEVPLLALAAIVLTSLVVGTRLRNTSHLWLAVVLAAFIVEILVSGEIVRAPFSVAWYMGVLAAFVWQALFLAVQLVHGNDQLFAFAADQRTLVEQTLRDPLTGVYNRRGFNVRFEEALAHCRLARAPIALLALDLDHFKLYNDHYGHAAGDEALQKVALVIDAVAHRPADTSCRVGGEEFAIVLPRTDLAGAEAVAERVRGAVIRMRIPHARAGSVGILTVSIGVACAEGGAPLTGKDLYERADRALYRAKRMGRNRFASYDYTDSRDTSRRVG